MTQTFEEYLQTLPEDRIAPMQTLRNILLENLPEGFSETMNQYGLNYVVPYEIYPAGYHCAPKQPLPFLAVMSNKGGISVYHMGIYAKKELYDWVIEEFPKHSKAKLDIGKSCIKFKKVDQIPFSFIQALAPKMSVAEWINLYETLYKKSK